MNRFLLAFATGLLSVAFLGSNPVSAYESSESGANNKFTKAKSATYRLPDKYPVPVPGPKSFTPNTMMAPISNEARNRFFQSSLALSPFSVRDLVNIVVFKLEAEPGISYDDVVASMKQKANKINFKFVGVNSIYKDVEATTGKPTSRVEVFNFCDAMVARELLDYSLEFVVFLPCRIAVVEDANQKIWLAMLDWDVSWVKDSPNPNRLPEGLIKSASRLRKGLEEIMQAGAKGEI
jgi:uncharacterized protein (DUF302 family)